MLVKSKEWLWLSFNFTRIFFYLNKANLNENWSKLLIDWSSLIFNVESKNSLLTLYRTVGGWLVLRKYGFPHLHDDLCIVDCWFDWNFSNYVIASSTQSAVHRKLCACASVCKRKYVIINCLCVSLSLSLSKCVCV